MPIQNKSSIQFLGILSNVDSSILKLPLEHGLRIESMPLTEARKFIGQIEGTDPFLLHVKFEELHCIDYKEQKIYFLTAVADPNPSKKEIVAITDKQENFDKTVVNNYLFPLFRKLRLFKDGNIFLPRHYYYPNYKKRNPKAIMRAGTIRYIVKDKFVLKNLEVNDLVEFTKKTKIPIYQPYIQLAFQNFETSYHIMEQELQFLLLMISLEALFNPAKGELRHRISRSIAVLLGNNKSQSDSIFSEMKKFYDKRSDLVHNGKVKISNQEIKKLRHFVREAIKSLIIINKKKDDILLILDQAGFGDNLFSIRN